MTRFHDTDLRTTPLEMLLPSVDTVLDALGRIRTEAQARGGVPGDPVRFMALEEVAKLLAEVRSGAESGELAVPYAALVLHGVRWDEAGRVCLAVTVGATEQALEGSGRGEPVGLSPPADAGWMQLPRNLFWMDHGDGPPEPIEGFYWFGDDDGLSLLLAAGVRPDRPGLSVIALEPLPWETLRSLPEASIRDEGGDFENTLPGGELSGLRSIVTTGEAFKLAALLFALAGDRPEWLSASREPASGQDVPRSVFPYRTIDPSNAAP